MNAMDNHLIWGFHPVYEALQAKRRKIHDIRMVLEKVRPRGETLIRSARKAGIPIQGVNTRQLTAMVGHNRHQGICARVTDYPLSSIGTILRQAQSGTQAAFILALDQIVDPQNFGAIARTAHCAGIHGLVIPKHHSAPPSAAASKASAGALEHMHVAMVTNLADALKHLKSEGLWLAGADQNGKQTIFEADLTGPLAIIVGSEEKGIRPLIKKQCDFLVAVPQTGPIGSLNASAASAVIIYEAFRQRCA
jgi:23S rRNA (guanosine2251-2'-O)-methyltransferase